MDREINLIRYLPPFMQDYQQLQEITNTENPEIKLIFEEGEQFLENQFILSCNEQGISRYEKMLNIKPYPEDTLEIRIQRVFLIWIDRLPYTYRVLLKRLEELCGEGNYAVIPDFDNYAMEIKVHLTVKGQVEQLVTLLDTMIPCNIGWISRNALSFSALGSIKTGGCIISGKTYTLSVGVQDSIDINTNISAGSAAVSRMDYTLSSGVQKEENIKTESVIGGNIAEVKTYTIMNE